MVILLGMVVILDQEHIQENLSELKTMSKSGLFTKLNVPFEVH